MATCSPEEVVEDNGPDKIHAKFADSGLSCEKNANEKDEKKLEDDEMSVKSSCGEANPSSDVQKSKDDVLDLSLSDYKELLDEASQPMFKRDSSNPVLKKVIDGTNFEDSRGLVGSGKVSFSRKDSRKYWEKRNRLDSYGHCAGTSAASRTTQGGSLQNLHGKPEGKKLHKSGSLTTFSSPDSELEGLKYIIFSSPCWDPMKAPPPQHECNETSTPPPGCVAVSGTSYSTTAIESTSTKTVCLESIVPSTGDPQCPSRLQPVDKCYQIAFCDESLTEDRKTVSVNGKRLTNASRMCDKLVSDAQKVELEEIEMMDIDCSRNELEDDCLLASPALDSTLPSSTSGIRWSTVPVESAKLKEGAKVVEVDRAASIPLQLKAQRSSEAIPVCIENLAKHSVENYRSVRTFSQDSFPLINMRSAEIGIGEISQVLKKTEGGFRSLDENGNPVSQCGMERQSKSPPFMMSSLSRSESDRDNRSRIDRTDVTHSKRRRFNKHFKINNRQKDINPAEIDGYFGDLDVTDILKRIEDHEDEKMTTTLGSKKKGSTTHKDREVKTTGTRAKKASSNRDMTGRSKLYPESETVIRLNGTAKEDNVVVNTTKKGTLDVSLMNGDVQIPSPKSVANSFASVGGDAKGRDCPISDKIRSLVCSETGENKVGLNGCPNDYSYLSKPNVESTFRSGTVSAKMLSVMCGRIKEEKSKGTDGDATSNPSQAGVNHVMDGEVTECVNTASSSTKNTNYGSMPVSSVSSFVVDFYANPTDVPAILEDLEFREVKKKKKKRPQSSGGGRNDSTTHYQRYSYCGGGGGSNGGGNNSSGMGHNGYPANNSHPASTSWADLPPLSHHHHRSPRSSDDVRRKSTGSVPPSEHSSADDSDVESVHSLPVSSTTPRPIVTKTSSSSSCTPQASYADIAKMATTSFPASSTVAATSSSRVLGNSCPVKGFVALRGLEDGPKVMVTEAPVISESRTSDTTWEETKRDASTWTCSDDHQSVNDDNISRQQPVLDIATLKRRLPNPQTLPLLPCEAEDRSRHSTNSSKCVQDISCHGRESLDLCGSGKQLTSAEARGNRVLPFTGISTTSHVSFAEKQPEQLCTIPNLGTPPMLVTDVVASSSQEVPSTMEVGGGRYSSGSLTPTDVTTLEVDRNEDVVSSSTPGVVFIGMLESVDEELPDVTFGFELNEELLRMTTGGTFPGLHDLGRTGSGDVNDNTGNRRMFQREMDVDGFEVDGELEHRGGKDNNQGNSGDIVAEEENDADQEDGEEEDEPPSVLNIDHRMIVPEVRVSVSSEAPCEGMNNDELGGTSVARKPWACRPQLVDELDTCNYNYRNVVEYFGKAWNGVQAELEKESKAGSNSCSSSSSPLAKVQYYQRE